ncbi:hypothetical protein [Geminicoccus flavidas]|uniref:hypothetical protein n=1 Tax=Geminicoccus flavidas TaxID=2506407 RepID=UPI001358C53C|nr:hypothetical protein [Geminicoccus flavidas]
MPTRASRPRPWSPVFTWPSAWPGVERALAAVLALWRSHDGYRRRTQSLGAKAVAEAARELAILLASSEFRLPCRIRGVPAGCMAGNGHGGWNLASDSLRH